MSSSLLVIDDSLTVRKLVEIAFKGSGANLEFAVSGQEGLAKAAHGEPPEAILLDYILPDMRGTDVCRRLSEDPRLARVPVVLMSAKSLNIREQFAAFPSVVDFVVKPFSREEISLRLRQASARPSAGSATPPAKRAELAPPRELFTFEQKQAAARAIFAHLKPQLAQLPTWAQERGDASPAGFFAKKLLTPEVMDCVLEDLAPLALDAAIAAPEGGTHLLGQVSGSALMVFLQGLETGRRSGVLSIHCAGPRLAAYWKDGALVAASSFDPAEYQRESALALDAIAPSARASAEEAQRASAIPVYASLAQAGQLSRDDARRAMARQGRRLLRGALREPSCRLEWSEAAPLPSFAEELGEPIPVAQLWLERLRAVAPWKEVERAVPSSRVVFERGERFSAKVRALELSGGERGVLSLVDGRASVQQLVDRSGAKAKEAHHILYRLAELGLIRRRAGLMARPKVLVLEPDLEGFRRPLAVLLAARCRPLDLAAVEPSADLAAAVLREQPALVLLNAAAVGAERARELAESLSKSSEFTGGLVALLEPDGGGSEALEGAPFDAVLVKPVHVSDLDRLLPS